MIELRQASKVYQSGGAAIRAVNDVTLSVGKGEFVAVVGHSGSGKTTLVSLMGGLTRPTSGSVLIDGVDIWSLDNKRLAALRGRDIGFCFQFSSLIPTLNCLDNVRLPAGFGGRNGDIVRAQELLSLVGVPDKANAYPSELSGGQQRRVAIARAMMNSPRLILADEPTGDLDEETEADIMDLISKRHGEGTTIIMVTHSRELASRAQRLLTMTSGSVSENGSK